MEIAILKDIVIIFALSTLVNLAFTRFRLPTAIGYLLTGVIAGPHLLSLISSVHELDLMAEIGVALLLFAIGMEFSLNHLLKIRRIVFFGGLLQVLLTAGVFFMITSLNGIGWKGALMVGFIAALSSSALVLKLLQERSELTSNYGRTVLGILIFQDLLLVPLILFTDILGNSSVNLSSEMLILALKAVGIVAFVYAGNRWILPALLHRIALAKNQELFMMSIFLICFAVAMFTSWLGMSLAFGAFLAGLMISESEYSHNAFGNLIPVKDIFTSFFFVSIGMLLDLSFVMENWQLVVAGLLLVVTIKGLVAGGVGFILGHTFRGTVLVGLALAQVGEFSFVLAKISSGLNLISTFYYQLFIAIAVLTMALAPFLIKLSSPFANQMLRLPLPKWLVEGLFPLKEVEIAEMKNHLVIIGKDLAAIKLSTLAGYYKLPHVSIIFDPMLVREKIDRGEQVVYGDAVNDPILHKAHVESADVVVVSVGSIIPSLAIIEKIRAMNRNAHIISRAKHVGEMEDLYKAGANQVVPEKFEIAVSIFDRVLTKKLFPVKEINRMIAHIRSIHLGKFTEMDKSINPNLFDELNEVNISAIVVDDGSEAEGRSIKELDLRQRTGVTVLAIKKSGSIVEHPVPEEIFEKENLVYILGNPEQVSFASELFRVDKGGES
jgi:CPA2 family monovalent cation:H+ antiporter-2